KRAGLAGPSTAWAAAWALTLAADSSQAEAFLWQAHERVPNNTTFLMMLAFTQSQRGKLQSAIMNASKAVSLEPDEPEHAKLLIEVLLNAGRLGEAEQKLHAIEAKAANDPEIALLIVRACLMRRQLQAASEAAKLLLAASEKAHWLIRLAGT